ncbi:MAG: hypothetical protein LBJ95_01290 [Oscillospiraceae bacterium]|jgi:hypothetical protein|nr:hypothetical protein [Oscillospiraceae bacterium]
MKKFSISKKIIALGLTGAVAITMLALAMLPCLRIKAQGPHQGAMAKVTIEKEDQMAARIDISGAADDDEFTLMAYLLSGGNRRQLVNVVGAGQNAVGRTIKTDGTAANGGRTGNGSLGLRLPDRSEYEFIVVGSDHATNVAADANDTAAVERMYAESNPTTLPAGTDAADLAGDGAVPLMWTLAAEDPIARAYFLGAIEGTFNVGQVIRNPAAGANRLPQAAHELHQHYVNTPDVNTFYATAAKDLMIWAGDAARDYNDEGYDVWNANGGELGGDLPRLAAMNEHSRNHYLRAAAAPRSAMGAGLDNRGDVYDGPSRGAIPRGMLELRPGIRHLWGHESIGTRVKTLASFTLSPPTIRAEAATARKIGELVQIQWSVKRLTPESLYFNARAILTLSQEGSSSGRRVVLNGNTRGDRTIFTYSLAEEEARNVDVKLALANDASINASVHIPDIAPSQADGVLDTSISADDTQENAQIEQSETAPLEYQGFARMLLGDGTWLAKAWAKGTNVTYRFFAMNSAGEREYLSDESHDTSTEFTRKGTFVLGVEIKSAATGQEVTKEFQSLSY